MYLNVYDQRCVGIEGYQPKWQWLHIEPMTSGVDIDFGYWTLQLYWRSMY